MSKDTKHTAHELRHSILGRMDAARKGFEEISEEELESICGGAGGNKPFLSTTPSCGCGREGCGGFVGRWELPKTNTLKNPSIR